MRGTHMSLCPFSLCHIESRTSKDNIEIHAINTNCWVILYSKINVLLDSKSKVT